MTDGYSIRRATVADAGTIADHRRAMFADMGDGDAIRRDAVGLASLPWLEKKLSAGDYIGWLAIAPDQSVAAGAGVWLIEWPPTIADLSGRRGMLLNVYTHAAHRRRGLARALVETSLQWCQANGITVVILHASDDGRPLYEAVGFKPTNEMRLLLQGQ
jgi:GNAT superfamily N-acetyltransferase